MGEFHSFGQLFDCNLNIKYKCNNACKPVLMLEKIANEIDQYIAMISFIPFDCSIMTEDLNITGEFIILLDRSGSMQGEKMK